MRMNPTSRGFMSQPVSDVASICHGGCHWHDIYTDCSSYSWLLHNSWKIY